MQFFEIKKIILKDKIINFIKSTVHDACDLYVEDVVHYNFDHVSFN